MEISRIELIRMKFPTDSLAYELREFLCAINILRPGTDFKVSPPARSPSCSHDILIYHDGTGHFMDPSIDYMGIMLHRQEKYAVIKQTS
jgi:hypothetical protein